MPKHPIYPESEAHSRNLQHLAKVLEELSLWRYRIHSSLLVASTALLALSSTPPQLESDNCRTLLWLRDLALMSNVLQLLSSLIVLCVLLYIHIDYANTAQKELQNPAPREVGIAHLLGKSLTNLFRGAEITAFSAFAISVVLFSIYGLFAS